MAAFHGGDVPQVDRTTRDIRDDGIAEFRDRFEFVKRADQESLVPFLQASTREIDVLGTDPLRDLFDANPELRQFLLIDLDLDLVFQPAADLDGGRAFLGFEVSLDAVFGQASQ